MFNKLSAIVLLYALFSTYVLAQNNESKNYVINVHGIVCELCSYGVAKNIRKLSFIDKKKLDEGVKVDVKNQNVFIAIRNDAKLDQTALYEAIESGGYKPVKISLITESGEHIEVKP